MLALLFDRDAVGGEPLAQRHGAASWSWVRPVFSPPPNSAALALKAVAGAPG
ncbi:hypothetical protein [Streptomyces sp. NBC_01314]|uniref:hypothetical protein n=1 Tax=Streptomyces sp. NBC_01314 TaxID=2903821 RepID=UPI00308DAACA|nr:hypothetical protein OG622_48145 [Streptomyces sp. NBC_01314]